MLLTVATLFAAFAAPPQCTAATVTTAAGVPVDLAINCTGAGPNPTVTTVGYLGSFTGPPLIGALAGPLGLTAALALMALAALAAALLARPALRR